jgi:hypothetical protein
MKMAAATTEARTTAMGAMALAMIAHVALTITHFITCNVVANAIAHVVMSACNEEGDGKVQEPWQL